MDAVVLTAMAKQPDRRYQSTQAMHGDLARVIAGPRAAGRPGKAVATADTRPILPAAAGLAAARPRWGPARLLAAAGIVVALMVAMLWPDGTAPAGRAQAVPTVVPASTRPPTTTTPPPTTAPSQSGRARRAADPDRGGHQGDVAEHGKPRGGDKPKAQGKGRR
jgi:hypothetical protein